jgi:signal transduction histidine kinase/CheY-like chemotaxis protein
MLEKIISKYLLKEILDSDKNALAITDKDQKVLWFNQSFKKKSPNTRIKGKSISKIFNYPEVKTLLSGKTRSFPLNIPNSEDTLIITPLKTGKKLDGYLLRLPAKSSEQQEARDSTDSDYGDKDFQKEFQDILALLVKETSLQNITDEILRKGLSLGNSLFSCTLFIEDKKKFTFHYFDPNNHIENKEEIERDLKESFTFIKKWLGLNKKSLIIENQRSNIGYHLTEILQCNYVLVLPCFFDNTLKASVIIGNNSKQYLQPEINILEQFASLLAFAITSTRTRELNTALENRLLQAQKLETIGKLSSGMAHDFNNLLSSIFGSLNLLKKRVPQNENILRLVDNIENCSVRARDLTKGLLSYGKPTPKRKELIKPNFLLTEISKVVAQTFPKNVSLNKEIDSTLYDILGNGTEIYQILLNLCVNAKEAMEGKKGVLTLKAINMTVDNNNIIDYPLLSKGNYVCFTVKDTGSGIDEENLQKIFDPYFSTKEKDTGSGLGLYVAYGIIKAHNGHIEVTSKIDDGTRFDVYLPSYEPTKVRKATTADKIILLADDEIMLRDLLAELLESSGYNVIKVISGTEVLRVLTEEIKVDLIILDYNMPQMNGLDCATEIRKFNKDIPIILSSGSLGFNGNVDIKGRGINNFVNKPYEFDTMLATIQELL